MFSFLGEPILRVSRKLEIPLEIVLFLRCVGNLFFSSWSPELRLGVVASGSDVRLDGLDLLGLSIEKLDDCLRLGVLMDLVEVEYDKGGGGPFRRELRLEADLLDASKAGKASEALLIWSPMGSSESLVFDE